MKQTTTRTVLRTFVRVQAFCLCVLLTAAGANVAAARTETTARGIPAAVQTDKPVTSRLRLPDRETAADLWEYAGMLPAPVGNLISLYFSIPKIDSEEIRDAFSKVHNFLKKVAFF